METGLRAKAEREEMDILYIIKEDHERILELCNELDRLSKHSDSFSGNEIGRNLEALLRETKLHLHLEETYLYPEVTTLYPGADTLINQCIENHKQIVSQLEELNKKLPKTASVIRVKGFTKSLELLSDQLRTHFSLEQEELLPKVRQLIPTQDREDLGHVFHDVKEEFETESKLTIPALTKKQASKASRR